MKIIECRIAGEAPVHVEIGTPMPFKHTNPRVQAEQERHWDQDIIGVGYGQSNTNIFGVYFRTHKALVHHQQRPQRFSIGLDEAGSKGAAAEARRAADRLRVRYEGQYEPGVVLGAS